MRLIIDGHEVTLDKELSIEYVISNPFFTKDGGYTLDISVNLNIPSNAMLYKHMQRLDVLQYPKKRSAVIESEGRPIIQGTEIILSVENCIAKIQIVEGNSELNYISSARESIRDVPNIGVSSWVIPILVGHNKIGDRETIITFNFNPTLTWQKHHYCPKLLGIINDVIRDAGFEIGENVLNNVSEYNDLYIVPEKIVEPTFQPQQTAFKEFLPAWSANEFFTEIEKFFNVIFIKKGNKVNIQSLNEYFNDKTNKIYIDDDDVVDDFNKQFDVDTSLYTNYANVRYDLPDKDYYKYADISDEVRNKCSTTFLFDKLPDDSTAGNYTLFMMSMYYYYVVRRKVIDKSGNEKYLLMQCQQFKHKSDDSDNSETTLKIIPAHIVGNERIGNSLVAPYIGDVDYETFEMTSSTASTDLIDATLNDEIENGVTKENLPSRMKIAFISEEPMFMDKPGSPHNTQKQSTSEYFQSWTTPYVVSSSLHGDIEQVLACSDEKKNLSIEYRYEQFYKGNLKIDTTVEYTIRFKNNKKIYDAKAIFYIHNITFYCKQLKYMIDADGITDIVEGIFYKVK